MASRLSTRTGMAVMVSCQLASKANTMAGPGSDSVLNADDWSSGLDSEIMAQRAAALAEKEIWRLLQEKNIGTNK